MKILICVVVLALALGCITVDKCQAYAALAQLIALQLAEDVEAASAEGKALRERWAHVAKEAVHAGCEQWAEVPPE